jgi:LmbE family N-acetylglucosaminyl deacetylase
METANTIFKPGRRTRRILLLSVLAAWLPGASLQPGQAEEPASGSLILQELRDFQELGSVLYVAAHPDDENTQLIAFLARGRHYRTAYLSLTRGDGGQNVLGPEFGEELGVIRTEELLAARRIDGGRQYFSRAIDFGFSKDYQETLRIWDREQVLSDIVRVIREFRPDVVITRFSPVPGRTHGHHTASAVLAIEAFGLAGKTNAFADQLGELTPWQPRRILWNEGGFQRVPGGDTNLLRIEVGGSDPVSGETFAEIAARSRAMHKTQGFDNFRGFGGRGPRSESFRLLEGAPATNDILDGVDTTWSRYPGGAEIGLLTADVFARFDPKDPSASVPALLKIRSLVAALPSDPVIQDKRGQLDRVLQTCLGLTVETLVADAEVVPGETMRLQETADVESGVVPVRWLGVRYPVTASGQSESIALQPGRTATREATLTLPADTPLTQPYWLREQHTAGMYRVADPSLIGRPENPPAFPVEYVFDVGGQRMVIHDQPVQLIHAGSEPATRRRLDVIAPVAIDFSSEVALFHPGTTRPVEVDVSAARPGVAGTISLQAPAGWKVEPPSQSFQLNKVGARARFAFKVTAPAEAVEGVITAQATVNGARYANRRVEIHYRHIPPLLLQPPARLKAVSLDLAIRGRRVGYIPGAGDSVAEALRQMGYEVTSLTEADLTPEKLKEFDAVVVGIRALNVRKDLAARLPGLFDYVKSGGNVIMQYNNPNGLQSVQVAPFELRLSQERVTDETAPVTFLAPDNAALTTPNRITSADFDGWVQERGLYFPSQWDDHFIPLLACSDPGEAPLKGGLLVAQYGKGYFVYTGLAWFRQLPAGVPGAYRLFANLVSLGK